MDARRIWHEVGQILEEMVTTVSVGPKGPKGDKGDKGDTGSPGTGGAFTPTLIEADESFTVPTNRQVLFTVPIVNDGELILDGELVEVD